MWTGTFHYEVKLVEYLTARATAELKLEWEERGGSGNKHNQALNTDLIIRQLEGQKGDVVCLYCIKKTFI